MDKKIEKNRKIEKNEKGVALMDNCIDNALVEFGMFSDMELDRIIHRLFSDDELTCREVKVMILGMFGYTHETVLEAMHSEN